MNKFWNTARINDYTAEMLLYGYIGDEDQISAGEFVNELKNLEKSCSIINIRINSGGGSIFEGLAIFNAIKNSSATINAYIDGIAASMATVVAIACKKVYMSRSAMFMTHRASGISAGNANDFRSYAEMMEHMEKMICSIYALRTGLSVDEAKAKYMQGEDRWITADQALSEKLVDGIYDDEKVTVPTNVKDVRQLVGFYNSSKKLELNMIKQIVLPAQAHQLACLKLPTDADANAVLDAILSLNNKVTDLENKVISSNAAKKKAEDDLAALQASATSAAVDDILEKALNTDKKITVALRDKLKADYKDNPIGLKALVDALPGYSSITDAITQQTEKITGLAAKSWDELDKTGELEELKSKDINLFKQKYKDKFGKDWTGK